MIYMRGQKEDYDHWASLGNEDWSWDDVLPVFQRLEDYEHGAVDGYGAGGELRVEDPRVRWEIIDAWRAAAAECGIPPVKSFNSGDNSGCAYFQMNQRARPALERDQCVPAARPAAAESDGALEFARSKNKIRGEKQRRASNSLRNGEALFAKANRETILALGSIGSPQILQLSGVGPEELLKKHHIKVVQTLPGVGENLHDHLQIRMQYKVKNVRTLNEHGQQPAGARRRWGWSTCFRKTGPLTMPPSQLGAFAKSDPSQPTPNIEWHVQPLSLDKFGDPLHAFPAITPSVCNLRPTLARLGADQLARSRRLPGDQAELPVDAGGPQGSGGRHALHAPHHGGEGAGEIRAGGIQAGCLRFRSDSDLEKAAGELGTTIFHPVGTCKMGSDPLAVVDDRLRVHGVDRLRVIDASIMPRITSGNTNAPTYLIAEKGARIILGTRD